MLDYVKVCLFEKYADFSGRARRKEYWFFALFQFLLQIVLFIIVINFGTEYINYLNLLSIVFLVPNLAVMIRRLHDVSKSGWYLLFALIPILGAIYLLILFIHDSQPGVNQYGPNPKENNLDNTTVI